MAQNRADHRAFHYTYRVTCIKTEKVFYGLHSTDDLEKKFEGKGAALHMSFKNHGRETHQLVRIQFYPSRTQAKIAYNALKASQLANPIRPEDKKFHFVYKTTRFDGKFYIGVHSTDDMDDRYKGSGVYLARSLKKYGVDKHVREILHECPTRQAAFEKEKEIVSERLLHDPRCMNRIQGGREHGGRVYGRTAESNAKQAIAMSAAWSAGRMVNVVVKNTGKKRSPEQLANLARGLHRYYSAANPEALKERGQAAARTRIERGTNLGGRPKGIPMSEDQKARQSAMTKGKALSAEHREALKKPKSRISCMFCRKETTTSHLPRYHAGCS